MSIPSRTRTRARARTRVAAANFANFRLSRRRQRSWRRDGESRTAGARSAARLTARIHSAPANILRFQHNMLPQAPCRD